jgi:hypothetical protein
LRERLLSPGKPGLVASTMSLTGDQKALLAKHLTSFYDWQDGGIASPISRGFAPIVLEIVQAYAGGTHETVQAFKTHAKGAATYLLAMPHRKH